MLFFPRFFSPSMHFQQTECWQSMRQGLAETGWNQPWQQVHLNCSMLQKFMNNDYLQQSNQMAPQVWMQLVNHWQASQWLVVQLLTACLTMVSTLLMSSSSVSPQWKRRERASLSYLWKHFMSLQWVIISTRSIISRLQFLMNFRAKKNRCLKWRKMSDSLPSISYRQSLVSLKGAFSKPKLPGELLRMKLKSMWMMCPQLSTRILLLCRSLIWKRYCTTEQPARLYTKLEMLLSQLLPKSCLQTSLRLEVLDFSFRQLTVLVFSTNQMRPLSLSKGMTVYVLSQILMCSLLQICCTIDISCIAMCSCLRSSPDFIMNDLTLQELRPLYAESLDILSHSTFHSAPKQDCGRIRLSFSSSSLLDYLLQPLFQGWTRSWQLMVQQTILKGTLSLVEKVKQCEQATPTAISEKCWMGSSTALSSGFFPQNLVCNFCSLCLKQWFLSSLAAFLSLSGM